MTNVALGPLPDLVPSDSAAPGVRMPGMSPETDDYPWEPAYSEAPDYEERADHEATAAAAAANRQRQAFLYETPEWERPQFDPPHLDTGRHADWAPHASDGEADEATGDQRGAGEGPGWRSIPRAE